MGENEQINQNLQDTIKESEAKVRPFVPGPEDQGDQGPSLPQHPYKFLDYFEAADQPIFFGRDEEADILQNQVMLHSLTVLFGQSGVGKTSLINAGVIPQLEEKSYTCLYLRVLREPTASIKDSLSQLGQDGILPWDPTTRPHSPKKDLCSFLKRTLPSESHLVIFLDQFEEFFVRLGKATRAAFAEELAACLESDLDLRFVFSLRDDYLARLHSWAKVSNLTKFVIWPVTYGNGQLPTGHRAAPAKCSEVAPSSTAGVMLAALIATSAFPILEPQTLASGAGCRCPFSILRSRSEPFGPKPKGDQSPSSIRYSPFTIG